jgi:hypothetical protein
MEVKSERLKLTEAPELPGDIIVILLDAQP